MQPGSTVAIGASARYFKAALKPFSVENESYAWSLSRYIHLNPVRAKMVRRPEDYAWGSYRYFLNARASPDWLDWQVVLDAMGKNRLRTRNAYRRFVEKGLHEKVASPFRDVVEKVLLGSEKWVEKMRQSARRGGARRECASAIAISLAALDGND